MDLRQKPPQKMERKVIHNHKLLRIIGFLRAFFPLQLLFGHLKYNLFSLFFWFILFSIASDTLGSAYGIPYLFYSPEYQGQTGFMSFFLIGFSFGGFTMSFHTYSYIKLGKKYPFMLTISKPFIKFCLNNSILPTLFLLYFLFKIAVFHRLEEFASWSEIILYCLSLMTGFGLFILISFLYFFPRNKTIFQKLGITPSDVEDEEPIHSFLHKRENWSQYFKYNKHRRYIYLASVIIWKTSRSVQHYDKLSLDKIMRVSRISSSLFEGVTIVTFLLLGIFREYPAMDLPAGMSIIMLLAITMMFISAIQSWLQYWTYPTLICLVILMNYLSIHTSLFQYKNYAYGMSYENKKLASYNLGHIRKSLDEIVTVNQSRRNFVSGMNQWKERTKEEKPKLIIIMTSGGGSRSAMWTFSVLQHLDQKLNGKLSTHTQMITGASGGMIGASYYRSLYLQQLQGKKISLNSPKYSNNIAKDLLNKLSFTAYSNDLFFRVKTFKRDQNTYTKDRAYSFEQNLNENTGGVLNTKLSYFEPYEQKGWIPTMIFSPTVVNDGRRLFISSRSLAFMCGSGGSSPGYLNDMYENLDFQTLFKNNNNVDFLSVLRMNATFPLVLPMVSMPTRPEMHLMDAGIRDNYGGKVTMAYLFSLKDWIKENTSGVIILKIRDTKKILNGETVHKVSMLNKVTLPFGNMYKNFTRTQDFDQDELIKIGAYSFDFPIDMVVFNLRENSKDRISLSWHLTSQEKNKIKNALKSQSNRHAEEQLKTLLH